MGPCCVEGCEVTSQETFYFEFPTSRLLRRKWLELIPIPGKLPLGTVVCSRHFNEDDYENVRGKVRLKRKVVPSLMLDQKTARPKDACPKSCTPPKDTTPESPKSPETPKSPSPPSPSKDTTPKSPESPETPISPKSPPKPSDICDSTTVSVPSPVDAEKMIDDIQKRIAVSINKLMHTPNGVSADAARTVKSPPPPLDHKEDIEDMITNYHIKNKVPNPALLADLVPSPALLTDLVPPQTVTVPVEFELVPQNDEPIEIEDVKEAEPVFIEVSVDKDANAGAESQDCLMLLESVQVDVDPTALLLAHDDDYYREEEETKANKKDDPISLLTSSDEDDVILQEPHIDTVEVSDETDEDDVPLVRLVKKKPEKKKLLKKKSKIKSRPRQNIEKIMWGMYDFYCVQCHFSTKNAMEYNKHISGHSKVMHVCPICSYTSASKSMYARHIRIHKVEKKFKCHLCDYRARHKMSLIYHLKNHDTNCVKSDKDRQCKKCNFKTVNKSAFFEHLRLCEKSERKHLCDKCEYSTKKKSDLKRHRMRRHREMYEDDDVDYVA